MLLGDHAAPEALRQRDDHAVGARAVRRPRHVLDRVHAAHAEHLVLDAGARAEAEQHARVDRQREVRAGALDELERQRAEQLRRRVARTRHRDPGLGVEHDARLVRDVEQRLRACPRTPSARRRRAGRPTSRRRTAADTRSLPLIVEHGLELAGRSAPASAPRRRGRSSTTRPRRCSDRRGRCGSATSGSGASTVPGPPWTRTAERARRAGRVAASNCAPPCDLRGSGGPWRACTVAERRSWSAASTSVTAVSSRGTPSSVTRTLPAGVRDRLRRRRRRRSAAPSRCACRPTGSASRRPAVSELHRHRRQPIDAAGARQPREREVRGVAADVEAARTWRGPPRRPAASATSTVSFGVVADERDGLADRRLWIGGLAVLDRRGCCR